MTKKATKTENIVAMVNGVELDQPCLYGERCETHAVYCNNPKSDYRKCHHSWYYGRAASILDKNNDETCKWFAPNPKFKEDKVAVAKEVVQLNMERDIVAKRYIKWDKQGWLCHRCMNGLIMTKHKVNCLCVTQPEEVIGHVDILRIPNGSEIDWKKECVNFRPRSD